MKNLVGRKIKGFEFEGDYFNSEMKEYIDKIGLIKDFNKNTAVVEFDDATWGYPIDQIQPHLIPLENVEAFKLGQKVWDMGIQEEAGVVAGICSIDFNGIIVDFTKSRERYKIDGINEHGQKTLSTTPYTFLGFSQETIIERGALVYMRDTEDLIWYFGFYDEFKEKKHYIFQNQQKEGDSFPWVLCQTENPLI